MKVNELELIEGCRRGDNSFRRQLYELYSPQMMAICYRYTGDKSLSQDLLHDGFIKVFESFGSFCYLGNGSLQAWISRIFRNLLLDFLRKNSKRDNSISLDDFQEEGVILEEDDFEVVPDDVLMRFISELPTGYRTIFNLYIFEEMSHKEISRMMGINESSSRSQLTRAKMILSEKIKKYNYGMDKEKDILTKVLQDRFKDYEMPVENADAVWSTIEKDLNKPKVNSVSWRRIILLSGAAVIVMFFYLKLGLNRTEENNNVADPVVSTIISKGQDTYNENAIEIPLTPYVPKKNIPVPVNIIEEKLPEIQEEKNDPELLADELKVNREESKHSPKQDSSTYEPQKNNQVNYLYTYFKKKKRKNNLSFALAMGNSGTFSSRTENATNYVVTTEMINSYEVGMTFAPQDKYANAIVIDTKYSIPFSAGFSVRKHFTDFWALESGLTYTYLSSTSILKENHSNQTEAIFNDKKTELHYLGIPLKIVGSFYNSNRISLYLTAGGMGEFCMSGKEYMKNKSTRLDIPEIQWSVFAGAGINYKLINRLSLFFEPEIVYYFNDGSELNTIRKSVPFNVNLQAGLRLSY